MTKYNKLWIALFMGGAFAFLKNYDLVPDGLDSVVVDVLATALTGVGVYAVPNK